jgi:ABC-2 type transport system permease protein
MLFSFGIGIAQQRATKSDVLIRATPVRPWVYLVAQALDALLFALGTLVVLFAFGVIVGGIRLDMSVWFNLVWRLLLGSIPFIGLGFAIGYLTSAAAAAAVLNLSYLPMAFASGLFIPIDGLPKFIQTLAPYLPTYRYGQVAWSAIGVHTDPLLTNVLWLVGYAIAFFAIALRAYRLEEERRFS